MVSDDVLDCALTIRVMAILAAGTVGGGVGGGGDRRSSVGGDGSDSEQVSLRGVGDTALMTVGDRYWNGVVQRAVELLDAGIMSAQEC